jgi:myosin-5
LDYISAVSNAQHETTAIQQKLLATTPILQAFGNAKTVRNNNSSRFGKFLTVYMKRPSIGDNQSQIIGAHINTYLLEKFRVSNQPINERNFHVFYQLVKVTDEKRASGACC